MMIEAEPISFCIGREPSATMAISHACSPGEVKDFHRFGFTLSVPGIRAAFYFHTLLNDFKHFRDEIERLWHSLSGDLMLRSIEGDVELIASIDKLGHVEWRGRLMHPAGVGNTVSFRINDDQSSLPSLIAEIDAFIAETKEHGWGII